MNMVAIFQISRNRSEMPDSFKRFSSSCMGLLVLTQAQAYTGGANQLQLLTETH